MINITKALVFVLLFAMGCNPEARSSSGISKASVEVKAGSDGLTVEQRNIKKRVELESEPGSIKHLYVTSTETGQVLLYSTVAGKITSSGKRLTPAHTTGQGFTFEIAGITTYTNEIMQDDGTYGSSIPYIYWWDSNDRYFQHYIAGGQMLTISDQPITVNKITRQLEIVKVDTDEPDDEGEEE